MRVLHLFKTYFPDTFGGVERTIHAIAKGSSTYGIATDVLSLSRQSVQEPFEFDGHSAYKAKLSFELASTGFSLDAIAEFARLSERADVIHYHFPWPFMDLLHLFLRPKKPTLVTYHSDIVKQKALLHLYKPIMHRFLTSTDRIIATSPNYVESSEVLQRYRDKIEVIPIGLNEDDYPRAPPEVKQVWRARFPRPFFLFVGVLRYYKGLQFLIEAASDVDADVLIVGQGPMERDLLARAEAKGLRRVHFLGALSEVDKAALLELCTAFVFPSHLRSEAYGLSLIEATMFGKPMISCEIGSGTSFVNLDGQTGIVVPPGDPISLASAMNRLLDPQLNRRLCKGSMARYRNELLGDHMVRRYCHVYRELMKRKHTPG